MANQVVKVKRETIAACMTCPLCNNLFRDATTISECLHTFCRKCIYDKISQEELDCCPICNIDLGCVPLEKLRPDHNLQDVRAKIFPFKRRKVNAPEVVAPATLPVRRKERSLSSLVVSTPRVATHATMTGRRTKSIARKATALRGSSFSVQKPIKKDESSGEDIRKSSSSPESLNKSSPNIRQNSFPAEPSHHIPYKETENGAEPCEGKLDLWKPLNCLVEVANRTKSFNPNSQAPDNKVETKKVVDHDPQVRRLKKKENRCKSKVQDEKNTFDPIGLETVKPKKLHRVCRKREAAFGESRITLQTMLEAASIRREKRIGPIWLSLVASEDRETCPPAPQIPAIYLRIKNGNLPVSFIQKYLIKKLELTSEAEVEVKCMGQPLVPSLPLNNLVDLWKKTRSTSERILATIGSSAKDSVMILTYTQKLLES